MPANWITSPRLRPLGGAGGAAWVSVTIDGAAYARARRGSVGILARPCASSSPTTTGSAPPGCARWCRTWRRHGEVVVIAPLENQSGVARKITLTRPLAVDEVDVPGAAMAFAVDGTPVDCVRLAAHGLAGAPPDVVVVRCQPRPQPRRRRHLLGDRGRGLRGAPARPAVHRRLAAVDGRRARASWAEADFDFTPPSRFTSRLVGALSTAGFPEGLLLSVNVPGRTPRGAVLARLGKRVYGDQLELVRDADGRRHARIYGTAHGFEPGSGTDCQAIADGLVGRHAAAPRARPCQRRRPRAGGRPRLAAAAVGPRPSAPLSRRRARRSAPRPGRPPAGRDVRPAARPGGARAGAPGPPAGGRPRRGRRPASAPAAATRRSRPAGRGPPAAGRPGAAEPGAPGQRRRQAVAARTQRIATARGPAGAGGADGEQPRGLRLGRGEPGEPPAQPPLAQEPLAAVHQHEPEREASQPPIEARRGRRPVDLLPGRGEVDDAHGAAIVPAGWPTEGPRIRSPHGLAALAHRPLRPRRHARRHDRADRRLAPARGDHRARARPARRRAARRHRPAAAGADAGVRPRAGRRAVRGLPDVEPRQHRAAAGALPGRGRAARRARPARAPRSAW